MIYIDHSLNNKDLCSLNIYLHFHKLSNHLYILYIDKNLNKRYYHMICIYMSHLLVLYNLNTDSMYYFLKKNYLYNQYILLLLFHKFYKNYHIFHIYYLINNIHLYISTFFAIAFINSIFSTYVVTFYTTFIIYFFPFRASTIIFII